MNQPTEYIGRKLGMTAKVVRAYTEQQMDAAGSSLTVAIITRILSATPGLSQRELADEMGVEGPTMARHMDRLEADGIVTRTRDQRDRRLVRVELTRDGHALQRRLATVSKRNQRELTGIFDTDELRRFEEYLARIADHAGALLQPDQAALVS